VRVGRLGPSGARVPPRSDRHAQTGLSPGHRR
jgi:hypothetical protein